MVVVGDARQRRARLPLAARAQREHRVRRQVAIDFNRAKILHAIEIAGLARDPRDALHGPPDHDDFALTGRGGLRDRAQPRHVRREGRNGNPRGSAADEFGKASGNVGLGWRPPVAERIRGIPDQRETALVAKRTQLGFVGRRADNWRWIDLPIPGVKHGAGRRADDESVRLRDGMSHRHELNIERSEHKSAAKGENIQRDFGRSWLALPLRVYQRRGERRGIDRELEPRPQVEQRAEMILVRMGQHEAEEIVPFFHEMANVRHDEIDAGQRLVGKSNAKIDRDPLPALLVAEAINREIHANLAGAAKRREHEFIGGAHVASSGHGALVETDGGSRKTSPAAMVMVPPSGKPRTRPPDSSRASKRPATSCSARRNRTLSPTPAARASQSARMVEKPSPAFHCASRPSILTDSAPNSMAGATVAPAAARSVAGKSVSAGWTAQLTPIPTATALKPLSVSIRMPASFAPANKMSFGHLIASSGLRSAATSTSASWIASAATKESWGQCSAAVGCVSRRVA